MPCPEHLPYPRAQKRVIARIDDPAAGNRYHWCITYVVVGQQEAVCNLGMKAGFAQTAHHRAVLHAGLAGHVTLPALIELEYAAVAQGNGARLYLHQQHVAGGAENHQINFAVVVAAQVQGVPRDTMKNLEAVGKTVPEMLQHIEFASQARILALGGEAGRKLGHRSARTRSKWMTAWILPHRAAGAVHYLE